MITTTVRKSSAPQRRSASRKIADRIQADLFDSGELVEGNKLPSIRQISERFGFSRSSLVQALELLELDGLIQRRHGVGSFVTRPKKEEPKRATGLVGVIVSIDHNSSSGIMLDLFAGIEETARLLNRHFVFASNVSLAVEEHEVERLVDAGCHSIVINPVPRTMSEMKTDYLNRRFLDVQIVLVDMAYPEQNRTQVVFNNYQAGSEMTQLLLELGHRKIVFVRESVTGDILMHRSNNERHKGYCETMAGAGFQTCTWTHFLNKTDSENSAYFEAALRDAFAGPDRPTAVIAVHDASASSLAAIARRVGIRAPDDLLLAGFDNDVRIWGDTALCPTTNASFRDAGRLAARLAIHPEEPAGKIFVLPVPLLRRGL